MDRGSAAELIIDWPVCDPDIIYNSCMQRGQQAHENMTPVLQDQSVNSTHDLGENTTRTWFPFFGGSYVT